MADEILDERLYVGSKWIHKRRETYVVVESFGVNSGNTTVNYRIVFTRRRHTVSADRFLREWNKVV